jgi:GNAT superfamily N-acetyltransferase
MSEALSIIEKAFSLLRPASINSKEMFFWQSAIPHPRFTAVFRLAVPEERADARIGEIISQMPRSGMVWMVSPTDHPQNLKERLSTLGFQSIGHCPAMTLDVNATAPFQLDSFVQKVHLPKKYDEFFAIIAEGFQFAPDVIRPYSQLFLFDTSRPFEHYLLTNGSKPVATATLYWDGDQGAVLNMATLPSERKKGHGRRIVQHLVEQARKKKLKKLHLQSSSAAQKLYESVGFTVTSDMEWYVKR